MDGHRQDAYDLFLHYDVDGKKSYPLIDNRPIQIKALPGVLVLGFAMLIAAIVVPEGMSLCFFLLLGLGALLLQRGQY